MFSEWLLLKIELSIAILNQLRLQMFNALIASIALARLILQLLKRTIGIIKNWLKETRIEDWFKTILHESFLSVFEGLYIFLYALHFFRALLTLIDFFTDQDNKNLVEIYKFLYAGFKVIISILMLAFLIVMIAHGFAPLGMIAYEHIKILFRVYTFSKFALNFITLSFSFYQLKTCDGKPEHDWLKAQYKANFKKHVEILLVGGLITLTLTLVSLGLVSGPWLWVMIVAASILLLFDMAKAIYYHINRCKIPEPELEKLPQQNPLLDVSIKDYYYRKCRNGRLKADDLESNRIYLLKEIVIKIIALQAKLNNNSVSRFSFFSENQKIQQKITGLIQTARQLLDTKLDKIEAIIQLLISLQVDLQEVQDNGSKLIVAESLLQDYLQGLKSQLQFIKNDDEYAVKLVCNDSHHQLWKLIFNDNSREKPIAKTQAFQQSFFRKKADCGDILDACQVFNELHKKNNGSCADEIHLSKIPAHA